MKGDMVCLMVHSKKINKDPIVHPDNERALIKSSLPLNPGTRVSHTNQCVAVVRASI